MKIGIDISQIVYEGTGVATYTRQLVEALLKIDKSNQYVLFGSSLRKRKLLINFAKSLEAKNISKKFSVFPPKFLEFLWNGIHLFPIENLLGQIDVFHSSDWLEPPTRLAKRVTTIHDFAIYKHPETFSLRGGHDIVKNQKRKLFFVKKYSHQIIAVSEATKKDAVEILKIPEKKIKVIYEAADPGFVAKSNDEVQTTMEKFKIEGDYLLCVGTREPRKNLDRVMMSFAQLSPAYPNLNLVIAGKYGWGEDSSKNIQDGKLKSRVKLLGFVGKEDLACLYSGAEAFVYPSLYEGFGLPIVEALSCGCPVITSNLGAMKEISGGAAVLADPLSVESISDSISKVIRNQKNKEELKVKGLIRARDFSWDKTALQTLEVYRSLLE